jgi:hypothetical protein
MIYRSCLLSPPCLRGASVLATLKEIYRVRVPISVPLVDEQGMSVVVPFLFLDAFFPCTSEVCVSVCVIFRGHRSRAMYAWLWSCLACPPEAALRITRAPGGGTIINSIH